ncbi:hypothetical protein KIL84_015941 [Mauremys mutica]|uniref:Uncharacterized protein n=1 Tax=Mauremys mutica TaxID=74926 RepID=A0A9D4AQB0_9SAUR|nr:hypothetical protein KIL84_015941 [Mauremys mutica]
MLPSIYRKSFKVSFFNSPFHLPSYPIIHKGDLLAMLFWLSSSYSKNEPDVCIGAFTSGTNLSVSQGLSMLPPRGPQLPLVQREGRQSSGPELKAPPQLPCL